MYRFPLQQKEELPIFILGRVFVILLEHFFLIGYILVQIFKLKGLMAAILNMKQFFVLKT